MNYDLSKIRIKCAEIIGWKLSPPNQSWPNLYWTNPITRVLGTSEELPHFPTSADAALELVAWMEKPENEAYLWYADNVANRPKYTVAFISRKKAIQMTADTFPLAICLAFLKANGIDTETL